MWKRCKLIFRWVKSPKWDLDSAAPKDNVGVHGPTTAGDLTWNLGPALTLMVLRLLQSFYFLFLDVTWTLNIGAVFCWVIIVARRVHNWVRYMMITPPPATHTVPSSIMKTSQWEESFLVCASLIAPCPMNIPCNFFSYMVLLSHCCRQPKASLISELPNIYMILKRDILKFTPTQCL